MRPNRYDLRERERFMAYVANEAFYLGDPSQQLTVLSTPKRDEVRAVFNYARDVLNKHASATVNGLHSQVRAIDSTDHDTAAIQRAQAALDQVLIDSNAFTTDFSAALEACVLGDGAFYVSHFAGQVFYRSIHPGDVDVIEWRADNKPARVMVQQDQWLETWDDQAVTIHSNGHEETYANPYGLIPVVVWPNWPRMGSRWGDSNLEHIKAACRLLNERMDLLMWLIRVQGNPPVKALGVDKATLRTDPGELWTGPADAQIDLVKLLDAETAGIHAETIKLLLQTVKELSNTPDIAYGIHNTQLSGRALELAYMPMTQAANIRRGFLGDAIQRRNAIILRMVEVLQAADFAGHYNTAVTFQPVIPADASAQRQEDRQDVRDHILSRETYLTRHGEGLEAAAELRRIQDDLGAPARERLPALIHP